MFKKLVLGVLFVGLLGGFVLGKGAWSYLTTGYERASQTVEESVPLEFQIDRARKMVRDLEPEIRRSMHVIAKEEVEVESLDKRIEGAETKAVKEKSEIMRLQSDLQTGKNVFRYAGHQYSSEEVKQDLSRRFVRFKTSDATLGSLADMRDARQRNLGSGPRKARGDDGCPAAVGSGRRELGSQAQTRRSGPSFERPQARRQSSGAGQGIDRRYSHPSSTWPPSLPMRTPISRKRFRSTSRLRTTSPNRWLSISTSIKLTTPKSRW